MIGLVGYWLDADGAAVDVPLLRLRRRRQPSERRCRRAREPVRGDAEPARRRRADRRHLPRSGVPHDSGRRRSGRSGPPGSGSASSRPRTTSGSTCSPGSSSRSPPLLVTAWRRGPGASRGRPCSSQTCYSRAIAGLRSSRDERRRPTPAPAVCKARLHDRGPLSSRAARSRASRAPASRRTPSRPPASRSASSAAVLVPFENRADKILFYWLGAAVFVVGSVLDILDGALARVGGKSTPFGAFFDSTTDRVGEGAMLAAIGLVFSRAGQRQRRSSSRSRPSPAPSSSRTCAPRPRRSA